MEYFLNKRHLTFNSREEKVDFYKSKLLYADHLVKNFDVDKIVKSTLIYIDDTIYLVKFFGADALNKNLFEIYDVTDFRAFWAFL